MTQQLLKGRVLKTDDDKRLVFGWAYVAKLQDGTAVEDHSGDTDVDPENLLDVAVEFAENSRDGGEMHVAKGVGVCVMTIVTTPEVQKAMGLDEDALPVGWFVCFKVKDDGVWKRVKDGELAMFSIGGTGTRTPIAE